MKPHLVTVNLISLIKTYIIIVSFATVMIGVNYFEYVLLQEVSELLIELSLM